MWDFSRNTDAGFNALINNGIQMPNACVIGYDSGSNNILSVLPNGGDFSVDANYNWTNCDTYFSRYTSRGMDIWAGTQGLDSSKWPEMYATPMKDENNATWGGANPFLDATLNDIKNYGQKVAKHFDANPYIRALSVLAPGIFGGIEYYNGPNVDSPTLYCYDSVAVAKFQAWLQTKYANLSALNTAWGTSYATWSAVQPPKPQRNMSGSLDTRQSWSDLMFWMRDFLKNYVCTVIDSMRAVSDKPLHLEIDGGYIHAPMESQAAMGFVGQFVKSRGYKSIIMGDSNADEVYGSAQLGATAKYYGFGTTTDNCANQTDKMADDSVFGVQMKGINTQVHSHIGLEFTEYNQATSSWDPNGSYLGTAELTQLGARTSRLTRVDPLPDQNDTVILNSFYTTNYRKGYKDWDYMSIYDGEHGVQWKTKPFASWAHYLDTPDILDDFPLEDGALANYKLLVVPNSSLTLTSDTAQTNILNWINGGKSVVGFGRDCLNYKVNLFNRSITGGTDVSNWMMGVSGGTSATTTSSRIARVASNAPSWLTSLKVGDTAAFTVSDSSQAQAFTALAAGATPVLVDEIGNTIMCEYNYGSGHVLFCTIPVSNSQLFRNEFMGKLLSDFADHAGVVRKIKFDGDNYHAAYMGTNMKNDKKLVVLSNSSYMPGSQTLSIASTSALNGSQVELDATVPWINISGGGIIQELTNGGLPQKWITYTVSSSQPLTLQSLSYSYIPIANVTAGNTVNPYAAKNVADAKKDDSGIWKGGKATSANPQTITVDFGGNYPVSGMELYPYTDYDENELFSFENGTYNGWAVTGNAFGLGPTVSTHSGQVSGWKGTYWADSQFCGETFTGTLQSPTFTINKDIFSFRAVGWDGQTGQKNQNYYYLKRASDGAVLASCKPPLSDAFTTVKWDVAFARGTSAYFQVVDNDSDSTYSWLGVNDICMSNYKEDKTIPDYSFEQGTYSGWTTSGTAFGSAPTSLNHSGAVTGWRGTYWADSQIGGEATTGTLTSNNFTIQNELLSFRMAGWDGQTGTDNRNYIYLKRASDNAVLFSTKPPQNNGFVDFSWNVGQYRGVSVYLQVSDTDTASSYAWLGIDNVCMSDNYGFERGTYVGWTTTGTAFSDAPWYKNPHGTMACMEGDYWADSIIGGESATGTLRSKNFVLQKPVLVFLRAGYDGQSGTNNQNYYYLKRASDNAVLLSCKPPQSDKFVRTYWDVSTYVGTEVYFQVADGDSDSGYAWLAMDDLHQEYNFNFETGSWAAWTTTGTAFGSSPNNVSHGSLNGYRESWYADSYRGGESATGTLRSQDFILEDKSFSFRMAGYDGQSGTNNQNYYYLKRASDGAVLLSAKPPQGDVFVSYTWDVSSFIGQKVYFEVVDGCSASGFAWLAVDDINWRGGGPRAFTVQTSTDNQNWTTVYTVTNQGNKYDSYSWTPTTARYVKLNITDGYNGNAMIGEMTFKAPLTQRTAASAAASSQQTGYEASKAIDGIIDPDLNAWVSTSGPPQWITIDLGSTQSFKCLELFPRTSQLPQKLGPQNFTIEVSTDNINWTTVYTAVNYGEASSRYTFPSVSARYVRLNITTGWNGGVQTKEIKIYQ